MFKYNVTLMIHDWFNHRLPKYFDTFLCKSSRNINSHQFVVNFIQNKPFYMVHDNT